MLARSFLVAFASIAIVTALHAKTGQQGARLAIGANVVAPCSVTSDPVLLPRERHPATVMCASRTLPYGENKYRADLKQYSDDDRQKSYSDTIFPSVEGKYKISEISF